MLNPLGPTGRQRQDNQTLRDRQSTVIHRSRSTNSLELGNSQYHRASHRHGRGRQQRHNLQVSRHRGNSHQGGSRHPLGNTRMIRTLHQSATRHQVQYTHRLQNQRMPQMTLGSTRQLAAGKSHRRTVNHHPSTGLPEANTHLQSSLHMSRRQDNTHRRMAHIQTAYMSSEAPNHRLAYKCLEVAGKYSNRIHTRKMSRSPCQ